MPVMTALKEQLIDDLWLPQLKEAKKLICPRRRKNAQMSLLTLTDGIDMREIFRFEEEKLIEKQDVVAWVKTMNKRWRAEVVASVRYAYDGSVYDDSFLDSSCLVRNHLPYDIINLDFHSQEPPNEQGRLEKETKKIETIFSLQKQFTCNRFVLIYTTVIDSFALNMNTIIQVSNTMHVNNWSGLNLDGFTNPVSDFEQKKEFLETFINKISEKYGYKCEGEIKHLSNRIGAGSENLFSLAVIMVNRNE